MMSRNVRAISARHQYSPWGRKRVFSFQLEKDGKVVSGKIPGSRSFRPELNHLAQILGINPDHISEKRFERHSGYLYLAIQGQGYLGIGTAATKSQCFLEALAHIANQYYQQQTA